MSQPLSNREMTLDSHLPLHVVGHANDSAELGLFTGVFAALTKALEGPAHWFILPAILMMDAVRAGVAFYDLLTAYNKNFNKVSKVLLEIAKVGLVGTAIIGTLAGIAVIAAITPFLFIGALGLNTVFHTAKTFFHGFKWAKAQGVHGKQHHKQQFFNNLVSTISGAVSIVGVTLLLALKPELGIFKSILAYGTAITLGLSALYSAGQTILAIRNKQAASHTPSVTPAEEDDVPEDTLSQEKTIRSIVLPKPHEQLQPTPIEITAEVFPAYINLDKDDLIDQIESDYSPHEKIIQLLVRQKQKLEAENVSAPFFQTRKRLEKINFISRLCELIDGNTILIKRPNLEDLLINTPTELLNYTKDNNLLGTVFGSFFREEGATQKLFLLADHYIKHHPINAGRPVADPINSTHFSFTTVRIG